MTNAQRSDWVQRIKPESPGTLSWRIHLNGIPPNRLPLVRSADDEPFVYDNLLVDVTTRTDREDCLIVISPLRGASPAADGVSGAVGEDGQLTFFSPARVFELGVSDSGGKVMRYDGESRQYDQDSAIKSAQYQEDVERFDSFLQLVTVGQRECLSHHDR